jgi:uncharacterized protein
MGQRTESFDLGRLSLSSGEGTRLDLEVPVADFEFGGQGYSVPGGAVDATLDVSHTTTGYSMRLRYDTELAGPCMRCLEAARVAVEVEAREVDQPSTGDEELASPYVDAEQLDLANWAHDALALALPEKLLCRPDCAGLCPVCGVSLNEADPADHRHETGGDPRWQKLRELKLNE